MKIAVFGAGAIGTYLAVPLSLAGAQVSVIGRGSQLAAIQRNGMTLIANGTRLTAQVFATADTRDVGAQDCVIVALKGQALPAAATAIASLMGLETMLVTAMNGIPYWYFHGMPRPFGGRAVESVDPGGALLRALSPRNVAACINYCFAEVMAPGVTDQAGSNKVILGAPESRNGTHLETLAALLRNGGLDATVTPNIHDELWGKLWGNLAMNPLSALTGATMDRLTSEPGLRALARGMMVEAAGVATALGITLPMTVDERIALAGRAGARKTSMLQDLERGRSLEIEPLLGAVVELGTLVKREMPLCRAVLALTRERGRFYA